MSREPRRPWLESDIEVESRQPSKKSWISRMLGQEPLLIWTPHRVRTRTSGSALMYQSAEMGSRADRDPVRIAENLTESCKTPTLGLRTDTTSQPCLPTQPSVYGHTREP